MFARKLANGNVLVEVPLEKGVMPLEMSFSAFLQNFDVSEMEKKDDAVIDVQPRTLQEYQAGVR